MADSLAQAVAGLLRTLTALLVVALAAGLTAVVVQGGPDALLELAQEQLGRLLALADQGTTASAQAADDQQPAGTQEPTPPVPPPLYHPGEETPALGQASSAAAPGPLVPVKSASFVRDGQNPAQRSSSANSSAADWESLQRQLDRLGVTRWRLETLPGKPVRVRFRCEVPHPVRPGWVRFFQAEATSPAEAIARVLTALRQRRAPQAATSR